MESDLTVYGEEVKFGGGKVIRDGMGQSQSARAAGAVDTVFTNALIIDHSGIYKADIGLSDGRIAAICLREADLPATDVPPRLANGPIHTYSWRHLPTDFPGASMLTPSAQFRSGARASIPFVFGHLSVGVAFGIAAARAGLSGFEATLMSAVVYAGASQFLVLALIGTGAPLLVTALSIIAVNLRHVFYGPAIMEKAGEYATKRHAWAWSHWMADGPFASALLALEKDHAQFSPPFMFGIGAGPYFSWLVGTAGGALFGGALGGYAAVDAALGFLMPGLFLAMVLSLLTRRHVPVVIVTMVTAIPLTVFISPTVGIVGAMVAGALSSLALPRMSS